MSLSMSNLVLLAKKQTARGTPAAPTAGANAILCRGLTPQPIKGKFVERNLIRGAKGNYGALFASGHRVFEFEIELAGSGAAGTAPKYGPLLMGCQMSETVTAGTSVAYQPHGQDGDYMTLIANLDGVEFMMSDAKGSWSLALNSEEIPVLRFTYLGKYHAVTDVDFPTGIDFTGFQQPLTVGADNTGTFTIAGLDLVTKSFSLDYANQVVWKDLINRSGVRAAERKPTANAVFEFTKVATRNWVQDVVKGTEMPLVITHGTEAGNIVSIDCPKLQFSAEPSLSDEDKVAMFSASFAVKPDAGNDEIVLTFT
nr:phage tail tube protein [uncultured Acidovorax sp.]